MYIRLLLIALWLAFYPRHTVADPVSDRLELDLGLMTGRLFSETPVLTHRS